MNRNHKYKLSYKLTGLLLVLVLMIPSLVKLAHAAEDHQHEVCTSKVNEHLHEMEIDCEFQTFQLSTPLGVVPLEIEPVFLVMINRDFEFRQKSVLRNIQLRSFLRGPPNGLRTTS